MNSKRGPEPHNLLYTVETSKQEQRGRSSTIVHTERWGVHTKTRQGRHSHEVTGCVRHHPLFSIRSSLYRLQHIPQCKSVTQVTQRSCHFGDGLTVCSRSQRSGWMVSEEHTESNLRHSHRLVQMKFCIFVSVETAHWGRSNTMWQLCIKTDCRPAEMSETEL